MCDRNKLAVIARAEAEKPYKGKLNNCAPNIQDNLYIVVSYWRD